MLEEFLFFAALNLAGLVFVRIFPMRDKVILSGIMTVLFPGFALLFGGIMCYEWYNQKVARQRRLQA